MNYHVRRQGLDLGTFGLDELRRRRLSGELAGNEYVQAEGTADWQPLDLVLQRGHALLPPPLPASISPRGPNQALIWAGIVGCIILCLIILSAADILMSKFQRMTSPIVRQSRLASDLNEPNPEAVAILSGRIMVQTCRTPV